MHRLASSGVEDQTCPELFLSWPRGTKVTGEHVVQRPSAASNLLRLRQVDIVRTGGGMTLFRHALRLPGSGAALLTIRLIIEVEAHLKVILMSSAHLVSRVSTD